MPRPARSEVIAGERKRRRDDTVDRTYHLKLAIPAEFRGDEAHEYRWINDRNSRVRDLTVEDDWEICQSSKVEAGDDDKVRRVVDADRSGNPVYAYLVRKPKDWYEADKKRNAERAAAAEQAQLSQPPADAPGAYVAPSTSITRRRGAYAP